MKKNTTKRKDNNLVYIKNNKIIISNDIGSYDIRKDKDALKYFINNIILNKPRYHRHNEYLRIILKGNYSIMLKDYQHIFNLNIFKPLKDDYEKKKVQYKISYTALTFIAVLALILGFKLTNNKPSNNSINNEIAVTNNEVPSLAYNIEEETTKEDTDDSIENSKLVLNIVDYSNNSNVQYVKNNYGNIIQKYADKYGLDYNLLCAIATQERGTHSDIKDYGGAVGLMQIQVAAHPDGSKINTITFENGVPTPNTFTFYYDNYKTLEGNIEAGCAMLNSLLHSCTDNNIFATMYGYNFGWSKPWKAIQKYALETHLSIDDVLMNYTDLSWTKYFLPNNPNLDYVKSVLRYLQSDSITILDNFGNPITINIEKSSK